MMTFISHRANFLIINIFDEGGPLFMYTTLITLIIILVLIFKELVKKDDREKTIRLVNSISLFTLVWGFLGQTLGFMDALDAIAVATDVSRGVLAVGLKISILSPAFGMVVFLIARIGILVLIVTKKE